MTRPNWYVSIHDRWLISVCIFYFTYPRDPPRCCRYVKTPGWKANRIRGPNARFFLLPRSTGCPMADGSFLPPSLRLLSPSFAFSGGPRLLDPSHHSGFSSADCFFDCDMAVHLLLPNDDANADANESARKASKYVSTPLSFFLLSPDIVH